MYLHHLLLYNPTLNRLVVTGYFQFILDNTRYVSCPACLIHCHGRNTHRVPSESICRRMQINCIDNNTAIEYRIGNHAFRYNLLAALIIHETRRLYLHNNNALQ